MFTSAGSIMVTIDDVKFAESKFGKGPNDFDICIHGTSVADPNQGDYCRLEMSQDYGKGNFSDRTQAQISADTLKKLGFEGGDLTTLADQIKGKVVPFRVEESDPSKTNGKVFYNVRYIETGAPVVEIDTNTVNARVAALFSNATAPAPMPTSPAAAGNPFAKKPAAAAPAATAKPSTAKSPFCNQP
jgi:hypothetical protein